MPPLNDILAERSLWTWNIMARSADLGEMIREDAITSVNLTTINQFTGETGLNITSFQGAKLEKEFGGDWFWHRGQSAYLVQAKRLDVVKDVRLSAYTINLDQLKTLTSAAAMLSKSYNMDAKPAYVFYNSMFTTDGINSIDPKVLGCTWGNADVIQGFIYDTLKVNSAQKTCTLTPRVLNELKQWNAWTTMFDNS